MPYLKEVQAPGALFLKVDDSLPLPLWAWIDPTSASQSMGWPCLCLSGHRLALPLPLSAWAGPSSAFLGMGWPYLCLSVHGLALPLPFWAWAGPTSASQCMGWPCLPFWAWAGPTSASQCMGWPCLCLSGHGLAHHEPQLEVPQCVAASSSSACVGRSAVTHANATGSTSRRHALPECGS
jgi:hypothetical protein